MSRSLLDIIAENERRRLNELNIEENSKVQESPFYQYNDEGEFSGIFLDPQPNLEAVSLSEIGDIAFNDLKDLNIFVQDEYDRTSIFYNDVANIDLPEIDQISEEIYQSRKFYNKYSTNEYIPYTVEDPNSFQTEENYLDYINPIEQYVSQGGRNIVDIFLGRNDVDDSEIGNIGAVALNNLLNTQIAFNIERATLGRVNNNPYSLISTGQLFRKDYDITVPKTAIGQAAEFLQELGGVTLPYSYLPDEVFDIENPKNLSYREKTEMLLSYTGLGQQTQLRNLVEQNIYKPNIKGRNFEIEENEYVRLQQNREIDKSDLVVTRSNPPSANLIGRYFETYGVESNSKDGTRKDRFSDESSFQWMRDIEPQFIGWKKEGSNPFNPKSLLYKTKQLVSGSFGKAFMDLVDKEFNEIIDGESVTISRGDGVTATGDWNFTGEGDDLNGFQIREGDFFRVWTKAVGYNKLNRTLRHRGLDNGDTRSVLNDNGLINFAPTTRVGLNEYEETVLKKYMFSIENLAWNDNLADLPECERGVGDAVTGHRGRIMWFPPYNLKIEENVDVKWNTHEFIGRGENVYTYNNTNRTATLSFSVIVDHPDIVNNSEKKGTKSQFWERYFKGDKFVEDEARRLLNRNLTRDEQDEIEKIRRAVTPKRKKVEKPKVTPKQKKKNENENLQDEEDNGGLGEELYSVYFPNLQTRLPIPAITLVFNNFGGYTIQKATIDGILYNNAGYETPNEFNGFKLSPEAYRSANIPEDRLLIGGSRELGLPNTIKVSTANGIRYRGTNPKNGNTINNEVYTFYEGSLITADLIGRTVPTNPVLKCPQGYTDQTNFGLNGAWYFDFSQIVSKSTYIDTNSQQFLDSPSSPEYLLSSLIKDVFVKNLEVEDVGGGNSVVKSVEFYDAVEINLVGNASAALTGQITNESLAELRAQSYESYLRTVVIPAFRSLGMQTEVTINTSAKADNEDLNLKKQVDQLLVQAEILRQNGDIQGAKVLEQEAANIDFCQDCDQPDKRACKSSRRVDIFYKILDDVNKEDDPDNEEDQTIDDVKGDDEYTLDDDESNQDPEDVLPEIDPAILNKLVYTECDFFRYLEVNQPAHYETISEKMDYFQPAFHSMTPQGFNSRLTFLHQCTRQADSIGKDDLDNTVNLAFGRPPVCILRIGDFYHTRFIITNMSINYPEGMTWDLNPEGIGVQPMYADISLNIVLLGGSTMTSPINRLQNSLSFNFYANTEMYDARSDSIIFDEGIGYDEETNEVKNGRILNGIKLSSLTNANESKINQEIAKLRAQSRIALPSQIQNGTPSNTTPSEIGSVNDLLEIKRLSNMPLTNEEVAELKARESQNETNLTDVENFEQATQEFGSSTPNTFQTANFTGVGVLRNNRTFVYKLTSSGQYTLEELNVGSSAKLLSSGSYFEGGKKIVISFIDQDFKSTNPMTVGKVAVGNSGIDVFEALLSELGL